jgi:Zn-finger nucleic acid-binding protein
LGPVEIEPNVTAQKCSTCAGLWLTSLQFANWIDTSKLSKPADSDTGSPVPTGEPKTAKICAECGYLMTRYKVGHSLPFSLDRCGHCGGTWFDGAEWEALVSGPLRNQIHLIFSPSWQSRIRHEEQVVQFRAQLAAKLGAADFAELNRIKAWLAAHPHRDVILASLNSEEA